MGGEDASLTFSLDSPQAHCCLYHYEENVVSAAISVNADKTEHVDFS